VNIVNTGSNISNRSTVLVLPMYICTLPILCEHERLSAIVMNSVRPFRLQALDGRRVDDETGYRIVLFQHLSGQNLATRSKVTGY